MIENTSKENGVRPNFDLSTTETNIVCKVLQSVMVLGVVPNLFPGVGLSICRRKNLYCILQDCMKTDECGHNLRINMHQRLIYVINILSRLLKLDVFASIMLTKHLGDLLAGFIQVSFAPIAEDDMIMVSTQNNFIIDT